MNISGLYKSYVLLKAFWKTSGKSKKAYVRTEPEDEARVPLFFFLQRDKDLLVSIVGGHMRVKQNSENCKKQLLSRLISLPQEFQHFLQVVLSQFMSFSTGMCRSLSLACYFR